MDEHSGESEDKEMMGGGIGLGEPEIPE